MIERAYVDGDEFDSSAVDASKWHIGFPWGRAMLMQDNYVLDKNFLLENGQLTMVVDKLDSIIKLGPYEHDTTYLRNEKNAALVDEGRYRFAYSTALLWSKRLYKYGHFEIKFKGVEGKGIWPAFWLYGGNPNYELDWFELKGERPRQVHVDVHCPFGCGNFRKNIFGYNRRWGHWVKVSKSLNSGYNIISGTWRPGIITWYLNGKIMAESNHDFNVPMNLVVGTGAAKENGPFRPAPGNSTPFPNYFVVDYIRVYGGGDESVHRSIPDCRPHVDTLTTVGESEYESSPKKVVRQTKKSHRDPIFVSIMPRDSSRYEVTVLGHLDEDKVFLSWMDQAGNCRETQRFTSNDEVVLSVPSAVTAVSISTRGKRLIKQLAR